MSLRIPLQLLCVIFHCRIAELPPVFVGKSLHYFPQQIQARPGLSPLDQSIGEHRPNSLQIGNCVDAGFSKPLTGRGTTVSEILNRFTQFVLGT